MGGEENPAPSANSNSKIAELFLLSVTLLGKLSLFFPQHPRLILTLQVAHCPHGGPEHHPCWPHQSQVPLTCRASQTCSTLSVFLMNSTQSCKVNRRE